MGRSLRAYLLVEDMYGPPFFKALIDRLRSEGYLPKGVEVRGIRKLPGKCNAKTGRILRAAVDISDVIVIVADAEGASVSHARQEVETHIPSVCRGKTHVIVLDYCLEEWVCVGLGVKPGNNPGGALGGWVRKKRGAKADYQKWMLPRFVPELDLARLVGHSSFRDFLSALIQRGGFSSNRDWWVWAIMS